ncbi:hypothetical protein HDA35_000642 [Micromonospora purpureochromogenes]|uniref:DUF4240 domain-containing protein n=1 Tax=Micromonospora purpureochromogenes TaxID=47872 RepID=A0ABX2REP8_9ACTN|nr:hypothetical protein [Micromonospora purpureochromogenes]
MVERKLHDIDREDVHEVTDGSDDGFLYCRGWIVALGRAFYEAVRADPAMAVLDADCEEMCYRDAGRCSALQGRGEGPRFRAGGGSPALGRPPRPEQCP